MFPAASALILSTSNEAVNSVFSDAAMYVDGTIPGPRATSLFVYAVIVAFAFAPGTYGTKYHD